MSPRRPRIPSLVEHQKALVEAVAQGKEVGIVMPRRSRALIPVDRMTFVVEGHPVPKGRGIASVAPRGSKRRIIVRTPGETKAYEEKVRWKARTAASRVRWKIGKADVYHLTIIVGRESLLQGGDLDNIVKAIKDACNGVVYTDDCRVVAVTARLQESAEPFVTVTAERFARKDWL